MKNLRCTFARLVVFNFSIAAFSLFAVHAKAKRDIVFECPCEAEYVEGEEEGSGELIVSYGIRSHRVTGSGEIQLVTVVNWSDNDVNAPSDPSAWSAVGQIPGRSVTVGQSISLPIVEPDGGALLMVELYEQIADYPGSHDLRHSHEKLVLWPVPREEAYSGTLRFVDILTDNDGDGVGDVNERLVGTSPVDGTDVPGSTTIDVLALYDDEVLQRFGVAALAYFHHVQAVADAIFVDSGTNIRIRGIGANLIERSQESVGLPDIDGLDELTEHAGADLTMQFYVGSLETLNFSPCPGGGGCSGVGGARTRGHWNPVRTALSTGSSPLFGAHELGHAMGLAHSARQGETYGTFLWSRGHYFDLDLVDGRFGRGGTIMSYGSFCNVFSYPDASCHGRPRGQPDDHPWGADAVTSLDLVRFQVGANRPAKPDSDGDGFVDPLDALPADPRDWTDTDGDGDGDNVDLDDDNDGVVDEEDAFPLNPEEWLDADGDGVGDNGDEEVTDVSLVPDTALRNLIREALAKPPDTSLNEADLLDLTVLKGSDTGITDLTGLELATNLEELELRGVAGGGAVADLHPISRLIALRRLMLGGHAIADLSSLSGLTGLESLSLYSNNIGDLSPLSGLSGLYYINVQSNAVTDLSPLSELTRLRTLIIDLNHISDLSPLSSLANLESLYIGRNNVQDLSPLRSLVLLRSLAADGLSIADLSPLADLERLGTVLLGSNNIADLSPLAGLQNLRYLHIEDNNVNLSDVLSLPHATNLIGLNLKGLDIEDVSRIAELTSLSLLDLDFNSVSDVSPLGRLTDLAELRLESNQVSDISTLVRRSVWNTNENSPRLYLRGNPLSHESIHQHIPTLRSWGVEVEFEEPDDHVVIPDAALRAIVVQTVATARRLVDKPLTEEDLANLRYLPAYGAGVADLSGLEAATQLNLLYLGNNAVSDISPLGSLENLRGLDLSDNQISDLTPMVDNRDFAEGSWVTLDGNPLSEEAFNEHVPALLARGVRVGLDSVSIDVASAGYTTTFDTRGYFEALLGLEFEILASTENSTIAETTVEEGELQVTLGAVVGMTSVRLRATNRNGESATVVFRIENRMSRTITLFPSPSNPSRQGILRIINHSDNASAVRIEASDDDGDHARTLALSVDGRQAVQFKSEGFDVDNWSKAAVDNTAYEADDWQLEVSGALDHAVLSYVQHDDGFLSVMHDLAPMQDGAYMVPVFNPASNIAQSSVLRIVNPEDIAAEVVITGIDDTGWSPDESVQLKVPAGTARTLSADELQSGAGEGLTGALGDGSGKWRLAVAANVPLLVSSLLENSVGRLSNLSTILVDTATHADGETTAHLPLFLSADNPAGQGFVRIHNRGVDEASIQIHPYDDAGEGYGSITLSVGVGATVEFDADDLELGNATKDMPDGVGTGHGDWRLVLKSTGYFEAYAYVRARDGFLTTMHDVSPHTESVHWIATFNPASDADHTSLLRIVNAGNEDAQIVIEGLDDSGATAGPVQLVVLAGESMTVSANELENGGEGLVGKLGDGHEKWRLSVGSNRPVKVMNLMQIPTGELINLSTVPQ